MRKVLILLLVLNGCILFEETYRELSKDDIAYVTAPPYSASEMNDPSPMMVTRLEERWGVDVIRIEHDQESGKLYGVITPAVNDALDRGFQEGMTNPTSYVSWINGGITAAGVLLLGLLGYRGVRKNGRASKEPVK